MTVPPASGDPLKLPSDAELLEQTGLGSQTAFAELVNRHGRYLYGIARGLSGNEADAEDLVQETMIGALNSKFRGESQVRTWLVSILVRQAGMLRRKRSRQNGLLQSATAGQENSGVAEPVSRASGNAGADARLDLSVMLSALSPEHRQVIVLRELEQLSYEEMATVLGVPRGTVESRLHRAREELRKRFKGYQP